MMMGMRVVLGMVVCAFALPPQRPVVGIYTQDAEAEYAEKGRTYIAASYVKHLEMAGAQVIPVNYHMSYEQLDTLLPQLNAILLPGGEMPIESNNQWVNNIAYILKFANRENDAGRPFPVWATCLSFEAIMYLHSGQ